LTRGLQAFGYAGLAINALLGAKLAPDGVDLNSPSTMQQQVWQGPEVDIGYKRNFLNRSLVLGGGFKYKVGKNFLFVDMRYMAGLSNITKNTYTTSNGQLDKLLTNYEYASDFFRLDNLSLSVGFIKPLYDPRKRKPPVEGLLRKLGIKKAKNDEVHFSFHDLVFLFACDTASNTPSPGKSYFIKYFGGMEIRLPLI